MNYVFILRENLRFLPYVFGLSHDKHRFDGAEASWAFTPSLRAAHSCHLHALDKTFENAGSLKNLSSSTENHLDNPAIRYGDLSARRVIGYLSNLCDIAEAEKKSLGLDLPSSRLIEDSLFDEYFSSELKQSLSQEWDYDGRVDPSESLGQPLWNMHIPKDIAQMWETFSKNSNETSELKYWKAWYEALLSGSHFALSSMQSIASIPDDDWEARGDTLDSQIDAALLRNETIQKIRQIRANISKARATIEVRSHNNPPELVDEQAEVNALLDETSIALKEAEGVVDKPRVSSERLRSVVTRLYRLLVKLSNYTGKLIDVALKKGAEELGSTGTKWAIRAGVGYFAAQTETVQNGLESLLRLLENLLKIIG